jgi:hypothetical protein
MSVQHVWLDEFSDEIVPCNCTWSGWADWLSRPDPKWSRHHAAADGDVFDVTMADRLDFDVHVPPHSDQPIVGFDALPDQAMFYAICDGVGVGWDADDLQCDLVSLEKTLREMVAMEGCAVPVHVAVLVNEDCFKVMYRADPPRLERVATQ